MKIHSPGNDVNFHVRLAFCTMLIALIENVVAMLSFELEQFFGLLGC
jgi:hypothetical protein